VATSEIGIQAGPSMLMKRGGSKGDHLGMGASGILRRTNELPDRAVTSLCEIKFNRKDVKPMNVLMCRRLVAALYQAKAEANASDDAERRPRQSLPDYVPNQFVVLYGMKSLAVKNINEFLYGVRAGRTRDTSDGVTEAEPLLHFFWRATHHGVPLEDRLPAADFDFYLDLLTGVATAVGDEHTLNTKGSAFWHLLGSMHEIELPVFLLLNVANNCYASTYPELCDRLRKAVVKKAAERQKAKEPPKPPPSYKPMALGSEKLDSRGHLPLDVFLNSAMEASMAQRTRDAKVLDAIFHSWAPHEHSFEAFADMLLYASPGQVSEEQLIALYAQATSGDEPDKVEMGLIESELRKWGISVKRKPGASAIGDGVGTNDDIKAAGVALKLFGHHEAVQGLKPAEDKSEAAMQYKFASKWRKASLAMHATSLLQDLEVMRNSLRDGTEGGDELKPPDEALEPPSDF